MKKILTVLFFTGLMFSMIACGGCGNSQSATAKGFGGDLTVEVSFEEDKIVSVEVTKHAETPSIGTVAIETLPAQIVEKQSINLDTVSGATVSSWAILNATKEAIEKAGFDPNDYMSKSAAVNTQKTSETINVDIAIIGAGGAGMAAAIEATQRGKDVIIIEKMPFAGGNTVKATGGMNAADTSVQANEGIEDSVELFTEDTLKGGYYKGNPELVQVMAENSADAVEWLGTIGAPLTQVSFSGGASVSRIHQPTGGAAIGAYLVEHFVDTLEKLGIDVKYNTTATEIIMDGEKAVGIKANSSDKEYTINAKAVILATGGFGANEDLYASYREDLKGFVTTNHPGATGDGIVMAEDVGAGLIDIGEIQIHPTVHQATSIMVTEGVRGDGAILVNQSGKRFVNEMQTRDVVSAAEIAQEGGYAYVIFDQHLREGLKATEKYVTNGLTTQADTIEELAKAIGVDSSNLASTLSTWNKAVANQNDTEFGRTTAMEHDLSTGPYYAIKVAPGVHHTMGGVAINTKTEVLTAEGDIIPGLFAAGEVTGGLHGGNRIGGNAVADIVVFGRIAGENASNYVK